MHSIKALHRYLKLRSKKQNREFMPCRRRRRLLSNAQFKNAKIRGNERCMILQIMDKVKDMKGDTLTLRPYQKIGGVSIGKEAK